MKILAGIFTSVRNMQPRIHQKPPWKNMTAVRRLMIIKA